MEKKEHHQSKQRGIAAVVRCAKGEQSENIWKIR